MATMTRREEQSSAQQGEDEDEDGGREEQQQALEEELANLEEAAPLPIRVRIKRYETVLEEPGGEGETLERRVLKSRVATIERHVQMRLYNRMVHRRTLLRRKDNVSEDEWTEHIATCVLEVWQQSEPAMTKEALDEGLDADQFSELFRLFFGGSNRGGAAPTASKA